MDDWEDMIDEIVEFEDGIKQPDASINRYYSERYKRKTINQIRKLSSHKVTCHYGTDHSSRYEVWKAIKKAGWRRHEKRGWNDQAFRKKLYNSRVRHATILVKGKQYRKITRNVRDKEQEREEY